MLNCALAADCRYDNISSLAVSKKDSGLSIYGSYRVNPVHKRST
ncbi:MAG: hypothetical protein QOG67_129 [Verrucomicrobiota bacterium]|jgi:hypothetical protein